MQELAIDQIFYKEATQYGTVFYCFNFSIKFPTSLFQKLGAMSQNPSK